jgi:polygalacturonase
MRMWMGYAAGILLLVGAFAIGQTQPSAVAPNVKGLANYGFVDGGKIMNTAAIQQAIDDCAAAGGGRVEIPSGTFLTGPLNLKSNVDLHLDAGATLLFSRNFSDYSLVYTNFMGKDTVQCRSPITGKDLHNVSITGPGIIDGQGDAWRPLKKSKVTDDQWQAQLKTGGVVDAKEGIWYPTQAAMDAQSPLGTLRDSDKTPDITDYQKLRDALRPDMVSIVNCSNVVLDGPTFRNSAFWAIQLQGDNDVQVRNITVRNMIWAQNGDGIGFESCRNVLMENSAVYAGDDNIVLKSGKDAEGRRKHQPTQDVVIRNCTAGWGHGGFVLGSEMSGDIRNVTIENCVCDGTDIGLRFKSVRGRGGVVEDIHVSNITMKNINGPAISFDMYYEQPQSTPEPVSERTPCFRNFDLRNITCNGARQSILMRGLPELPLSDITMEKMNLVADSGASLSDVSNLTLRDIHIESTKAPAFAIADVTGLTLDHVDTLSKTAASTTQPDQPTLRPPK